MGDTCKQTEAIEQCASILIIFEIYLLPIGPCTVSEKVKSNWSGLTWGVGVTASGARTLLLMKSYCYFEREYNYVIYFLNCWAFYLTYISFKLGGFNAWIWLLLKLLLFFWEPYTLCFFALPLLLPLSLKCFFCLSPLHQHAGTQCFCTVGVGNLRRGFPALLFRLKSLQFSIATWIKKKKKKLAHYYSQNHLNV